jgi:rSAM/selenodomain-associated transferase 2
MQREGAKGAKIRQGKALGARPLLRIAAVKGSFVLCVPLRPLRLCVEAFAVNLSIIIPALNEASRIEATLASLAPLRARGHEVIVVDGGSADGTARVAAPLADRVLTAPRGRASQMNAGAAEVRGDVLLFLHADNRLPDSADSLVAQALASSARVWGRFDVAIEGTHPMLPVIARFMNARSRLTGIATGDQAMFVQRDSFVRAGGFPPLALMEDVALSARLKRQSRPACLRARTTTSGRRWESKGVFRTVFLMWRLRLSFFLGASPQRLARIYEGA